MHIIVKLMLYYSSIVKVTDAHIPVYTSHARTLWMKQMFIHTLLVVVYVGHCLSSLSVHFLQVQVENKHIFMKKIGRHTSSVPFQLLLWKFELRESPALAQHKLCYVLQYINMFSM